MRVSYVFAENVQVWYFSQLPSFSPKRYPQNLKPNVRIKNASNTRRVKREKPRSAPQITSPSLALMRRGANLYWREAALVSRGANASFSTSRIYGKPLVTVFPLASKDDDETNKTKTKSTALVQRLTNSALLRFASLNFELKATVEAHREQGLQSLLIAALEHSENERKAEQTKKMATQTLLEFPNEMHAIKLSALGASFNESLCERLTMDIAEMAREVGARGLCVDAEEDFLHEQVDAVSMKLMRTMNTKSDDGSASRNAAVYKTYQMYRQDSVEQLKRDIATAEREGFVLGAKLVRGAYLNADKGKPGVLFETKEETDESFADGLAFALNKIKEKKNENAPAGVKILLATRNKDNIQSALGHSEDVQFAQLMGMDDEVTLSLLNEGERVAKYFPYGKFTETLPYLWRRFLERASFS